MALKQSSGKRKPVGIRDKVVVISPTNEYHNCRGTVVEIVSQYVAEETSTRRFLRVLIDVEPTGENKVVELSRDEVHRLDSEHRVPARSNVAGKPHAISPTSSSSHIIGETTKAPQFIDTYEDIKYLNSLENPVNENCDAVPVERVGGIEDPRLKPNKLLWTDHKSESIALIRPSLKTQKRTELDWIHLFKCPSDIPKLQSRTPVDYFMLMFPRGILRPLLEKTTDAMTQQHTDISLTTTLLWKYIGLRLMFANDKIANIESSWHKPNSATDYHIPMNITQRFGVSLDTFRLIDECLTWGTKDKDEHDNWSQFRSLVEAFNERMYDVVKESDVLVVDELFSMWYEKKPHIEIPGKFVIDSTPQQDRFQRCPHCSFIRETPRGIGMMFKCLADGFSNIILCLEIHEDRHAMELKPYQLRTTHPIPHINAADLARYNSSLISGDVHQYHTAVTLRLCAEYQRSWKVIIGNNAFASIVTMIALLLHGLYFVGTIQTTVTDFPLAFLESWSENKTAGEFNVLTTSIQHMKQDETKNFDIMAVGYKGSDQSLCTIGSSIGSTASGNRVPIFKDQLISTAEGINVVRSVVTSLDQPKVIEEYHHFSHTIDRHNQLRQEILQVEEYWHPERDDQRIFATMMGIVVGNAYFGYRLEHEGTAAFMNFEEFMNYLIVQLCPPLPTDSHTTAPDKKEECRVAPLSQHPYYQAEKKKKEAQQEKLYQDMLTEGAEEATLKKIKQHHYYPRRECSECHSKTSDASHYCVTCSGDTNSSSIVAVHLETCWADHQKKNHRK